LFFLLFIQEQKLDSRPSKAACGARRSKKSEKEAPLKTQKRFFSVEKIFFGVKNRLAEAPEEEHRAKFFLCSLISGLSFDGKKTFFRFFGSSCAV